MTNPLAKMSAREKRLFAATFGVLFAGALFLGGRAAVSNLRSLDDSIDRLELEIENLQQQYVQRGAIDEAYDAVVTEHSSQLTAAEIHDYLRREIFSLAEVKFPATKEKPAQTMQLVRIPALDEGQLKQGAGHREYQIRIDIPSARLDFLLLFIERIERSEQLLRVDRLEIGRMPGGQTVHASMDITRTVLDNPEEIGDSEGQPE